MSYDISFMSYDVSFKVKVENADLWIRVGNCYACITSNLSQMIEKSTGLPWIYEADNGLCTDVMPAIYKGLHELETNPDKYKQYESPDGWGTLSTCIKFFEIIIFAWEDFAESDGNIANYAHFWIY